MYLISGLAALSILTSHVMVNALGGDRDDWHAKIPPTRRRYLTNSSPTATTVQDDRTSNSLPTGSSLQSTSDDVLPQTTAHLDVRQTQAVVNVDGDCVQLSQAWIPTMFCASYAVSANAQESCATFWSSTTGCNVNTAGTTVSASGPALTAQCGTDCVACNMAATAVAAPVCIDCITSGTSVFVSQLTAFPSGTVPPILTAPISSLSSATASAAPASSSSTVPSLGALKKRTNESPADYANYDEFMVAQASKASSDGMLVPHRHDDDGRSSALVRSFRNKPFRMAVEGLIGCTSVVAISRRGVYMSHLWEIPSFISGEFPNPYFDKDVRYGIWNGDNSGKFPGIGEFLDGIFKAEDSNELRFFIITSTHPGITWNTLPEGAPPEASKWMYMAEIMHLYNDFQTAGYTPQVVIYDYITDAQIKQNANSKANGRVVVMYDPKESVEDVVTKDSAGNSHNCHSPYASWALYVDRRGLVAQDTWAATEEQLRGIDVYNADQEPLMGRDDGQKVINWDQPVCVRVNSTTTTSSMSSTTTASNSTTRISTTSFTNTTTSTSSTSSSSSSSSPTPTPTCRIHITEVVLSDDLPGGVVQPGFLLYAANGSLRTNVTFQENTFQGPFVLSNDDGTPVINATFQDPGTTFDPSQWSSYMVGVNFTASGKSQIVWSNMTDTSVLPYCGLGGWTGSTVSDDRSNPPARDLDLFVSCPSDFDPSIVLPTSTIASTSTSTLSFLPTTAAPTPTAQGGTCRVHITERVFSNLEPNGQIVPTIELYLWNGTQKVSHTFEENTFASSYTLGDGDNVVVDATFQISPPDNSDADTFQPDQWSSYLARVTLNTPILGSTVLTNITDESVTPHCGVGPWTELTLTNGGDPASRDFDCTFFCMSDWDPTIVAPSVPSTSPTVSAAQPSPTTSEPSEPSEPTSGTCRVHITERIMSDEDEGFVQPTIQFFIANGQLDLEATYQQDYFGSTFILHDAVVRKVVQAKFGIPPSGADQDPTQWSQSLVEVTFLTSEKEVTVSSDQTDDKVLPYCGVGVWTTETLSYGNPVPTRDLDFFFECPDDFTSPVPSDLPDEAVISAVPMPKYCRLAFAHVVKPVQVGAILDGLVQADNPILDDSMEARLHIDGEFKKFWSGQDLLGSTPRYSNHNITLPLGDFGLPDAVLNFGVDSSLKLNPDIWDIGDLPRLDPTFDQWAFGLDIGGVSWITTPITPTILDKQTYFNSEVAPVPPPDRPDQFRHLPNCWHTIWSIVEGENSIRYLYCYWRCGFKEVSSGAVLPPPTSTAAPEGTCRLHVTQRSLEHDDEAMARPEITLYNPKDQVISSVNYAIPVGNPYKRTFQENFNGFVWNLTDAKNLLAVVAFDAIPLGNTDLVPDHFDKDKWMDYDAKVTFFTPNGEVTVQTSQNDNSVMPYCNVGGWTTLHLSHNPVRDFDCFYTCPWDWA